MKQVSKSRYLLTSRDELIGYMIIGYVCNELWQAIQHALYYFIVVKKRGKRKGGRWRE